MGGGRLVSGTGRTYGLFVDGQWQQGAGEILAVRCPARPSLVAWVVEATAEEVDWALASAESAAQRMAELPLFRRASILESVAERLENRVEEFAEVMTFETGRPIREMRADTRRAASILRQSADATRNLRGEMVPADGIAREAGRLAFTLREPLGVVGAITAFNFPLVLAVHKLGPALGGGNTVVLKPATQTSISSLKLGEIFAEVGLPPGALNVVTGGGPTVGERIVQDSRVAFVSFTGSEKVGKRIASLAGYKRIGLELGSNSANIVHHDADLDYAVSRLVEGAFGASGQSCISVQRIYVHEDIVADFLERFVEQVHRLKLGDPFNEETDVSPLIDTRATERTIRLLEAAVAEGAKVMIGGSVQEGIVLPTVLVSVTPQMEVCRSEIFAPVVGVSEYHDIDEAIRLCNDSAYGLQTGVFTSDLNIALHAARKLDTGAVQINEMSDFRLDQQPYGGVKSSGLGYEGPRYLIREMTRLKTISIRLPSWSSSGA